MLVFKELQNTIKIIESEIKLKSYDEDLLDLSNRKLLLLNQIKDYLYSYSWLTQDGFKDKIQKLVKSNFDYKLCSVVLDTSVNNLKVAVSTASTNFKTKIGVNTIDLIKNGDIATATLQFNYGTGLLKTTDFLIKGVHDVVSVVFDEARLNNVFTLSECTKEAMFLRNYSNAMFKQALLNLDKSKLAYILYLLENSDSKNSDDKTFLYGFINCSISVEEYKKIISV